MDIFSVLPFLLFILFVVITIFRNLKKTKDYVKSKQHPVRQKQGLSKLKNQVDKKQTGWKNLLLDSLAEIQREIKAAQEKKQQESRKIKEQKPVSSKLVWSKGSPEIQPPPVPSEKRKKTQPISRQKRTEPDRETTPPKKPVPASHPFLKPSDEQLRNAVVWSEILAPPIALRNDREWH